MTHLFTYLLPVTLLAAIPLTACAAPPSEPTVFAVPSAGESLNQFQADDLACRNDGRPHTASPGAPAANRSAVGNAAVGTSAGARPGAADGNAGAGAAVGASNANAIAGGAQAQYDVAYTQCMMSKGNTIVTTPPDYGYAFAEGYPDYYAYPGSYPYYGAYPHFIGTGPFFFGPRFHGHFHHGHFHHGHFHHGGFHHGGFHHGGFHHGGFHH